MSKSTLIEFESNGKKYLVLQPSMNQQQAAQGVYNRTFSDTLKQGALFRESLDKYMREQGLWDDAKELEYRTLNKKIMSIEKTLHDGGIKVSDGKKLAFELMDLRDKMTETVSVRTRLDGNTVEGQADNQRFNFMICACLVYNDDRKPVFPTMEDYVNNTDVDKSLAAIIASRKLASLMYGIDEDYQSNTPEVKFLKEYGFMNENRKLVNKDGKFVDRDGRLVDENGRYINEAGEFVDISGNLINENGDYINTPAPFLDDDGNPIIKEQKTETVPAEPDQAPPAEVQSVE